MAPLFSRALPCRVRSYGALISQLRGLCSCRALLRHGTHAIDSVSSEDPADDAQEEREEEEEGVFVRRSARSASLSSSIPSSSPWKTPSLPHGDEGLEIAKLPVAPDLVQTLARRGIEKLFPIQRAVLEPALRGQDLIARAKTGTGKTLAFGIPIIDRIIKENEKVHRRLGKPPLAVVMAPTRELAKQVEAELAESAPNLELICVYGGVSIDNQIRQLRKGVDIAVGTPGRFIDLIQRGSLRLNEVKYVVLDEADQMLAVGFVDDIRKIFEYLPMERQSMLFSATMPGWVKELAEKHMKTPLIIDLVGKNEDKIAEGIKLLSLLTNRGEKCSVLGDLIKVYGKGCKSIVFTKTKSDADDVAMSLSQSINCEPLHGDISQSQREKTLKSFRDGKTSVLVATDVASRGLDIPNVDLVVHYEVANDSETFVHRSGRTGRAGKAGTAILLYSFNQRRILDSLQRDLKCKFQSINPPSAKEVLMASAELAVEKLHKVHKDTIDAFLPTAEKLYSEQGTRAFAAALAHVSGFGELATIVKEPSRSERLANSDGSRRSSYSMSGKHSNNGSKPLYASFNSSSGGDWPSRVFKGKCLKCGRSGHRAVECPKS